MFRLFMTFWKLFKMLLRNAILCITSLSITLGIDFVGQAQWPQFHELRFSSPGEIFNSTKRNVWSTRVNITYNSLCCIPLKLSLLGLKKTIRSKKDFGSAYNWMF